VVVAVLLLFFLLRRLAAEGILLAGMRAGLG
jgi:hypothetical protein